MASGGGAAGAVASPQHDARRAFSLFSFIIINRVVGTIWGCMQFERSGLVYPEREVTLMTGLRVNLGQPRQEFKLRFKFKFGRCRTLSSKVLQLRGSAKKSI